MTAFDPFIADARPMILSLGRFTLTELAHALGVPRSFLMRHLDALEARGIMRPTDEFRKHNGPGRPARVYVQAVMSQATWRALHAEPAPVVNRECRAPVEVELTRMAKARPQRSRQVAQKRRKRAKDALVKGLLVEVQKQGYRVEHTANQHVVVHTPNGRYVAGLNRSEYRAGRNMRAELRKLGVAV